jgi:8-oxo-dGTP diphosphatase
VSGGGVARRLGELLPVYARLAWWGIASPRLVEREPLVVHQAVILGERGVLLSVRADLRGWELPGGSARPGEPEEAALRREVREETGLEVEVERVVGDYVRSGFRPHTARVRVCRVVGGELAPSAETPALRWFRPERLPETLFPWYRMPLADALAGPGPPVERHEHQGLRAVLEGMGIDLRMRLSGEGGEAVG